MQHQNTIYLTHPQRLTKSYFPIVAKSLGSILGTFLTQDLHISKKCSTFAAAKVKLHRYLCYRKKGNVSFVGWIMHGG